MNTPVPILSCFVAQRFEGDCNLDCIAVSSQRALRLHNEVRIEVFVEDWILPDAVLLNSEGIEIKLVCFPLVVEGVQQHADVIVVKDIVALGYICPHLRRIVITVKSYV